MKRNLILKGVAVGFMTGLVVLMFDSLFMLKPRVYVPSAYPLVLSAFNICLWSLVGLASGTLLAFFVGCERVYKKESFWWTLFFLLPFWLIYGITARIHIPPIPLTYSHPGAVFDHHLSFVWTGLILLFALLRFKKDSPKKPSPFILFCIEIATIIALFQCCSNLMHLKLQGLHSSVSPGISLALFSAVIYSVAVLCLGSIYVVFLLKLRPFLGRLKHMNNAVGLMGLFLVAVCLTCLCFNISRANCKKAVFRQEAVSSAVSTKKNLPKVILIVLDTLRAKRLGMYANRATSPNLDAFARQALVFENCVASTPWTLGSHASLFSGFYLSEHMCIWDINEPQSEESPFYLSSEFTTMAEAFQQNGYRTAGVISNYGWLHPKFGVHQGFQIYDCMPSIGIEYVQFPFRPILLIFSFVTNIYPQASNTYRTADVINDAGISLLDEMGEGPSFLFMNYMDVHGPYSPPRPYDSMFSSQRFPRLYKLQQIFARINERHEKKAWDTFLLSLYDGEITYLDYQLGRFFSSLKQRGLYDSSLIVITSDHGEFLGEHGLYEHQKPMYEEEAKVPLLIKLPFSKKTGRESGFINLADIYPTIMSLCGLPVPAGLSGKPFGGEGSSTVAEHYSRIWGEHKVLYDGKYKFMRYGEERPVELYDISADPTERENLAEKLPEVLATMRNKLGKWQQTHGRKYEKPSNDASEEGSVLSEEIKQNLRTLGYLE